MRSRIFIAGSVVVFWLEACNQTTQTNSRAPVNPATTTSPTVPSPASPAPSTKTPPDSPYVLVAKDVTSTTLFTTTSSATQTCATATFKVTEGDAAAANVQVSFSTTVDGTPKDPGRLTPSTAMSDANGLVSTVYCSGDTPTTVVVIAKAGSVSVNSAQIAVVAKPTFKFAFAGSTVPVKPNGAQAGNQMDAGNAVNGTIFLNLFDSGPNDCTRLYFDLVSTAGPAIQANARFSSQDDYPQGAKLSGHDEVAKTAVNSISLRNYTYADVVSNGSGRFEVPVCAGNELGNLLITGSYKSPDNVTFTVSSPVIVIQSGVTSWANMSLTYAQPNGNVLRALLNSNNLESQPFTLLLSSRNDGDAILDYPIFAQAETGKATLVNGGKIDPETSSAKFTVNSINLTTDRPYVATSFDSGTIKANSLAYTACDVPSIAQAPATTGTFTYYRDIAKNWRSTMVYGIRGQEHFYDFNKDGVFTPDTNCLGFWDKNQNGQYDAGIDAPTTTGTDTNCDWFIDLPSPFIDVNENGIFDTKVDRIIGSSYSAPNKKWDKDTIIWKSEYLPIYMGTSPFAMTHSVIRPTGSLGLTTDPVGIPYFNTLAAAKLLGYGYPSTLTDVSNDFRVFKDKFSGSELGLVVGDEAGSTYIYFFAQSICGTPLPGGSEISVNFIDQSPAGYGDRAITASFSTQPGDDYRDASRRLLSLTADNNSSAKISFDAAKHPSADSSFPVVFKLKSSSCKNACKGDVKAGASPGIACDAKETIMRLTVDSQFITSTISLPEYRNCNCVVDAVQQGEQCTCPAGLVSNGTKCDVPPP